MVREKGVQVLIEALPKVRWGYHDTKLLICGGGQRDHLVNLAAYLGMERHVYFAGFVPDDDLMKIYSIIDIACFPSLYEPFGIVALEAMAAHVPVVVSDAGGLPEVVENNVTGITTYAGNPNSLADGLLRLLHEPETGSAHGGGGLGARPDQVQLGHHCHADQRPLMSAFGPNTKPAPGRTPSLVPAILPAASMPANV